MAEKESDQSYRVEGHVFLVGARYELKNSLGRGAFGIVCSALDKETNTTVAIKKIEQPFRSLDNARKLVREIRLLRHFREHKNIVGLTDILMPKSSEYDSVYLVTELMDTDLGNLLKGKTSEGLTQDHLRYFLYQMLCGLRAIHAAKVMHRDMKPANVFVSKDCSLKIGDFGLARDDEAQMLSEYVVTRWYRAPELLMQWDKYDKAVDVWSLGCIFAEMLATRHLPLFPGKDYLSQLQIILDFIGTPEEEDYKDIGSEGARRYLRGYQKKVPKDYATFTLPSVGAYFHHTVEPCAYQLLSRMLVFNPKKRIDVEECLYHPYLGDYKWMTPEEKEKEAQKRAAAQEAGEEEEEEEEDDEEDRRTCGIFNGCFESYLKKPEGSSLSDDDLVDRAVRVVNQEICCMHSEFEGAPGVAERLPPPGEIPRQTFVLEDGSAADADAYDGMKEDIPERMTSPSMFTLLDALRSLPSTGPVTGASRDRLLELIKCATRIGAEAERGILSTALKAEGAVPWAETADGVMFTDEVSGGQVRQTLEEIETRLVAAGLPIIPPSGTSSMPMVLTADS